MDSKLNSSTKRSCKYSKGSLVALVFSISSAILLFLRIELVRRNVETMDAKLDSRIQRLEEEMHGKVHKMVMEILNLNLIPANTDRRKEKNHVAWAEDTNQKLSNIRVRRSLNSQRNRSLTIDDVRREIKQHLGEFEPGSLCQPSQKVCVPGPPGKKGNRGSRGRQGLQGDKGKKGLQGIMGPPGRHGKQGIMGSQGIKGDKGEKGVAGSRGMAGLKGDPGESITLPEVIISPKDQTVSENQTATFYCSATGNPRPTVTWSKVNGSLKDKHAIRKQNDGRLEVTNSNFNDSGKYLCTAVNVLGRHEAMAKLIVEVSPKLTKVPDRFLAFDENAVASITCEAFSYPPSVITWTRFLEALPKGRSSVNNGVLTIRDFSIKDTGTYACTATNKFGSVTAVTALGISQRKPNSCIEIESRTSRGTISTYDLKISSQKVKVLCHVTAEGKAWALIARFSNNDAKNWMRDDGHWWYDQQVAMGTTTDPSINTDMISPAFWLVSGTELKITRSDDPSHAPLLQTTGHCLDGQTFRSKITSYGDFRNGKVWSSNQCLGSCTVQYGGQYNTTDGFERAECSGGIQSSNKIGFWCDWGSGDGSVMMIGGGGGECARADHGIGITEDDAASFVEETSGTQTEYDFGYDAQTNKVPSQSYSLNLWIR